MCQEELHRTLLPGGSWFLPRGGVLELLTSLALRIVFRGTKQGIFSYPPLRNSRSILAKTHKHTNRPEAETQHRKTVAGTVQVWQRYKHPQTGSNRANINIATCMGCEILACFFCSLALVAKNSSDLKYFSPNGLENLLECVMILLALEGNHPLSWHLCLVQGGKVVVPILGTEPVLGPSTAELEHQGLSDGRAGENSCHSGAGAVPVAGWRRPRHEGVGRQRSPGAQCCVFRISFIYRLFVGMGLLRRRLQCPQTVLGVPWSAKVDTAERTVQGWQAAWWCRGFGVGVTREEGVSCGLCWLGPGFPFSQLSAA